MLSRAAGLDTEPSDRRPTANYQTVSTVPKTLIAVAAAIVALGCQRESQPDATKADSSKSAAPASGSASGSATTVATFDGVGRARIGTSVAQLREIGAVPAAGPDAACRVVTLDWLPAGTRVMLISDTVARIDADSTSSVRTVDGAGVGDTEARIHQLYATVTTQPHKYVTNGHYLSVASPNDSTRRIVFETDGNTVKRYRVGRRPEVDLVEGCG